MKDNLFLPSSVDIEAVARLQKDYPDVYEKLNWMSAETARAAEAEQARLLESIFSGEESAWRFSQTKPHIHELSPGCILCGEGSWSCLFINGICNARCFYCPSAQDNPGPPMTSALEFNRPEAYADYVEQFGIKGVSFSGGEPLLAIDKVLAFLAKVKSRVSYPVYTWMYTNGILSDKDTFKRLKDQGLDEIRFDLSADQYNPAGIEKAIGIIPRVTIEIPAIPEDLSRLEILMRQWADMGVNHLNLHQIRCTPYNIARLQKRGYTFTYNQGVTVLETELAALRLMDFALEQKIALPVQYCAYTYRRQFQAAASRKRYAPYVQAGYEDITDNGYIRRLTLIDNPAELEMMCQRFVENGADPSWYSLSSGKNSLVFSARLLHFVTSSSARLSVSYSAAAIKSSISYRNFFKTIHLKSGKSVVVEKRMVQPGLAIKTAFFEESNFIFEALDTTDKETVNAIFGYEKFSSGLTRYRDCLVSLFP